MMIYRVVLRIGYQERCFDFETINSAGEFARTVLTKQVVDDENQKQMCVKIEVIEKTLED